MSTCTCIESCYNNQTGQLYDKGKAYDVEASNPLICFFDCAAGVAARKAKAAKRAAAASVPQPAAPAVPLGEPTTDPNAGVAFAE